MMVFISKVNNYMFRPKAAIFILSQLQFCSNSAMYMSILRSYVEILSLYCMLQVSFSSGMSSGSMDLVDLVDLPQYIPNQGDPHPTIQ
jgi:hypothetical protein